MEPIGPLMWEHRLIERMIALIGSRIDAIRSRKRVDVRFVETVVDFVRTYADRCHHGKEEDILFRDLESKPLSPEHRNTLDELVEEHRFGRQVVGRLVDANVRYAAGDAEAVGEIVECLETLVDFYPKHIEKEDKRFFFPVLDYFSPEERDRMLHECYAFDRELIHEHYGQVVERLEQG